MKEPKARTGMRPARMKIRSAVLMMHGGDAWSSELEDISATGVLVKRPEGFTGHAGDLFVLDMMIGDQLNIHVEATVARVTEQSIGFAYARIPENKEVPLWDLLGGYADSLESYRS
ncbi:PilZ domain-containing protein [Tahibacter amnicola]|uniref:PilZ domain-containing protein n=1 Tax=Tahibacter amnicola TaxID=2976241 RepID=A0ABY6BJ15_9GAMM|nr:PilZ domain-containing protein [Tahibacter amnicola]UXI70008.1 PilZ domain-containing protein [Tahibacter amnicola]